MAKPNNKKNVSPTPTGKKNGGKQKVEMKKVEAASNRHVTFSKRKKGLLNKAAELSILTGAETAAIVVSNNNKLFGLGSPSCEAVIRRYLAEGNPHEVLEPDHHNKKDAVSSANEARLKQQHVEARRLLDEEKRREEVIQQRKEAAREADRPEQFWWNEAVMEGAVSLEESICRRRQMEKLKGNIDRRAQELIKNLQFSYTSLMDGRVAMGENYANNDPTSTSMNNM